VNLSKLVLEGRIPVTARGRMGAARCVFEILDTRGSSLKCCFQS
jgi:hypothetical protein